MIVIVIVIVTVTVVVGILIFGAAAFDETNTVTCWVFALPLYICVICIRVVHDSPNTWHTQ
jgi:amino acid transporter